MEIIRVDAPKVGRVISQRSYYETNSSYTTYDDIRDNNLIGGPFFRNKE